MDPTASAPQCSICLEAVVEKNGRATARLHCGHVFHLDCIGSEFNVKRAMQCPNCHVTEDGEWRFAAGGFEQSINNEAVDDGHYRIEMHPSVLQWSLLNGFNEFPLPFGERMATQARNGVGADFIIVTGDPGGSNLAHPRPAQPMGTRVPQRVSIIYIRSHQHSWIPPAPFAPVGNPFSVANQTFGNPATTGTANRALGTRPNRGSPAHIILGHGPAAGPQGTTVPSSSPPIPSSNGQAPRRIQGLRQRRLRNSPYEVVVRASRSARTMSSNNPRVINSVGPAPSSYQAGGYTLVPLSDLIRGIGASHVHLP